MAMEIESGDIVCPGGMPAFFARPKGGAPASVILMHERYGLVAHTRDLAKKCAADGFFALAPNFFHKHPDRAALAAGNARYAMTDPESVALMHDAVDALARQGGDPKRLAIAGYCQTGRHPLVFAAQAPIAAAIVWYGAAAAREWTANERQPAPLDDILAALPCPVFGAFGTADHIISVDDVQRFRNALETHGKSYEIHLYEGAPHGWLNDTMAGRYRQAQAEAGWAAQQKFLKSVFDGQWPQIGRIWRFEAEIPGDYDFSKNVRLE